MYWNGSARANAPSVAERLRGRRDRADQQHHRDGRRHQEQPAQRVARLEGGQLRQVAGRPGQVEEHRAGTDPEVGDARDDRGDGERLEVGQCQVGEQRLQREALSLLALAVHGRPHHA
ncbi:hypothetical protein ABT294_30290 [Nonomuraea sp. NPDC000554]|uniref:hypothetical protein n=1 Tax=Nonomuraea sp. NPDC000554 TaxID=3154259 RepID=UPI003326E6B4